MPLAPIHQSLPGLVDVDDRRIGGPSQIYQLDKDSVPAHFPITRWNTQSKQYLDYWEYYLGKVFNEEVENEGDEQGAKVLRYPLQINLFKTIAKKHAYMVCGEADDGTTLYVKPKITPKHQIGVKEISEEDENLCNDVEKFLITVWEDNKGRSKQMEGALIEQFLGGHVYKLYYDTELLETNQYPIGIELILPDFFLPVWKTGDPWSLLEVFIVYKYPMREAVSTFPHNKLDSGMQYIVYVEHWTKDTVNITLNNDPLVKIIDGQKVVYRDLKNPFGFIPIVYIPTERSGNFYGDVVIDDIAGIVREFNARAADVGDAVAESIHADYIISNTVSTINKRRLPNGRTAIDLGNQAPGVQHPPELRREDPPVIDDSLADYPSDLLEMAYEQAHIPQVALGKDEGSQRSGTTLNVRMWSFLSYTRSIRTNMTTGINILNRMILRIALIIGVEGLTEEHLKKSHFDVEWQPMVPKDRDSEVNELVLLLAQNGIHPETVLGKLDIVRNPHQEYKRIMEHLKELTKISPPDKVAGKEGIRQSGVPKKTGGGTVDKPTTGV